MEAEKYSLDRRAEFLLTNAVSKKEYQRARKEVKKLGLDPDAVPHLPPDSPQQGRNRRPDKNSIALAGEFAVLSQLALLGLNPSFTLGHTKGVDILVSNPKTKGMCRVEIKTKYRTGTKQGHNSEIHGFVLGQWLMRKIDENLTDRRLFYCFVPGE